MDKIEDGLAIIHESIVKYLLEFLQTGVFKNKTPNAYMAGYSKVHTLVDEGGDARKRLYNYYVKILTDYMTIALNDIRREEGERLIDALLHESSQCKILIYWMKKIFTYLDKYFYPTSELGCGSLYITGMKIFFHSIFIPIKEKIFLSLNKLITDDRDCQVVQRYKIKNCIRIIEEVNMKSPELVKENDNLFWVGKSTNEVVDEWFKATFQPYTESYISAKATREINSMSAPEYIRAALKYLDEEGQRKSEYIHKNYQEIIDQINNKYLIQVNATVLGEMETGIMFMLVNKKDNEVKDAYRLISKVPDCTKVITDKLDPFIRQRGEELYNNKQLIKDPRLFVPKLIDLKKEIDSLVEDAFANNIHFQDTKNKAFAHFMNKELYSKLLAYYTDYEMRSGMKGANEVQIEEKLNNIINLFKCLSNKLVFQLEYSKKLSDRLIQKVSISQNAEKNFISKLKAEVGVTYVNKMTTMLQDLEISKTEMDMYRNQPHRGNPNGIGFVVQVLQHGAWEVDKIKFDKFTILPSITKCMDDFNCFYIGRHKTHKLLWCYGLATVEIQFMYLKKSYQSTSTLCQYAILCQLERYEKLPAEKVAELLGHSDQVVLHECNSLIFQPSFNPGKIVANGIICGNCADGTDLKLENEIWVNRDFQASNLKLRTIPTAQKFTEDTNEPINLKAYYNMLIDSTITRIMKGRIGQKTTHVFLVGEVAKQIDIFQAQPPQIKERIECLIEKQIIKRNEQDRNCYDYIA